ncbi:MAG: hypothetical protein K0U47_12010 [Epsilonproteobacteria bacterium]|nr:hypothetical protein [Campylobacterota bacterium]
MSRERTVLDHATKIVTLKQCEAIIQEGLEAMYKVDRALSIINDLELFNTKHESFEAYCQAKWNIGNRHNYVFIQSSKRALHLPRPQNNITRSIYESRK